MSKLKYIFIYLIVFFFVNCKTQKKVVEEKLSIIKSDITHSSVETIKIPPIATSLTINEVCDSITGKPNDFKQIVVIGQDTLELSLENNDLRLKVNRLEQELSKTDSINKVLSSDKSTERIEESKTTTTSFKSILIMLILALLFLFKERIPLINLIKL